MPFLLFIATLVIGFVCSLTFIATRLYRRATYRGLLSQKRLDQGRAALSYEEDDEVAHLLHTTRHGTCAGACASRCELSLTVALSDPGPSLCRTPLPREI